MKTSFPKEKIKILLLENIHPAAVDQFKGWGYSNVFEQKSAMTETDLLEIIPEIHILGIRSKTNISPAVLHKAKKLLAIGAFCIGTNQIAVNSATEEGIAVFNSPYSNTRSVAELVLGEIIMLMRRIPEKNAGAHNGQWLKEAEKSYEVRGKSLGIIGYGHIGSQVSVLAESIGMHVIYYDVEPKLPLGNARQVHSLAQLLKDADAVTLHVPGNNSTKGMIGAKQLALMKEESILLNLSRGDVVDPEAVAKAIISGALAGFAADVFPEEPKSKEDLFVSPLQNLPNVILTPHIGGSTREAQENIGVDVSTKLINFIEYGSTVGSKTIPPVTLPVQQGTHRILHIHKNVPGVLSSINNIISELGINIFGQYLSTNEKIGYVVLDIEKRENLKLLNALKKAPATIKTRLLY